MVKEMDKEWFYMKNDLKSWDDIKGIIQRPIKPSFGFNKLTYYMNFKIKAAKASFNNVCAYIEMWDLV